MKLFKWPINPLSSCPKDLVQLEPGIMAEVWLVDVAGFYRLVPKAILANAVEQFEAIKKAEHTKNLWPPVYLRFDQTISINHEAARVLLEEIADNRQ